MTEKYNLSPTPTQQNYFVEKFIAESTIIEKMAVAVKQVFDLSLVGPDIGFKAEDVAKAAYDASPVKELIEENKRLREALQFYANPSDYVAPYTAGSGKLYFDCGNVAKAALFQEGK